MTTTNDTKQTSEIINDGILRGYTTKETAYRVDGYPWGFRLKTSIFYWIETKAGKGDRFCSYTIDPRTGRPCAPKYGTYSPFRYMYLDENKHVHCGGIDAYEREIFEARFYFILGKIGEQFLSEDQKKNIRVNYASHIYGNAVYEQYKYIEEKRKDFKAWLGATLKHIKTCEFSDLLNYPERPEQDNPDGEVKMVIREHEEKPKEETPAHTITAEKVTDILKKTLPKFWVCVKENKQTFGGNYLSIAIAASDTNINGVQGQKVQVVSLCLDLKTLELTTQFYGGNGGGSIYREPNENDPKERFLAMKSVKIPFRRPPTNEKDVLAAVERFAVNYKNTLIANRPVLKYQDLVNYDELLS